jgi:putative two-component system hydrogenase maturation factor HypX/HoxX
MEFVLLYHKEVVVKILLIASAFNGLCQRLHREMSLVGHLVSVELSISDIHMIEAVTLFNPDLIICPFLKERIPTCIWEKYVCLIVHPGIEGDRGPSSLDWAVTTNVSEWGVTLLQAAEEMDAGDIWGTHNFKMREASKASVYRREVTASAVSLVKTAVKDFQNKTFKPRPLNCGSAGVKGVSLPLMRQDERKIDWAHDATGDVIRKINCADSYPGVLDSLLGEPVYFYGAKPERKLSAEPGRLIAHSSGALCRATVDGAVWIRVAKRKTGPEQYQIKLPAAQVFASVCEDTSTKNRLPCHDKVFDDIRCFEHNKVGYLYFDFYNGAANTEQCRRLAMALKALKKRPVNVIALMGGEDFWCNGIHLNCIEAAKVPAKTAWENINAMDDLLLEIMDSPKQITVAVVRNNAGAGGAIMPLACDRVVLRDGVVLNPHYGLMGLHGSEYWTYLLPRRVGDTQAKIIMAQCVPMLAKEAILIGYGDEMFGEDWEEFHSSVQHYAEDLADAHKLVNSLLKEKKATRKSDEKIKRLAEYRKSELQYMYAAFFNPESDFHRQRYRFVHKLPLQETSCRLAIHRSGDNKAPDWTVGAGELLAAG